jgi:hypothetical protein
MKIETYFSPNCSELGLMITQGVSRENLRDALEELRKHKIEIQVEFADMELKNISTAAKIDLILLQNARNLTNVDRIMLADNMRKLAVPEPVVKKLLDAGDDYFDVSAHVLHGKSSVSLLPQDYCNGDEGILFQIGDGDRDDFPLLYKLLEIFGGEVYTIDGGHSGGEGGWEEYQAEQDAKKGDV